MDTNVVKVKLWWIIIHTDWHTHPNYGYSKYDRTHGSDGDFESKEKAYEKLFPRQIPLYFIILTKGFPPIAY